MVDLGSFGGGGASWPIWSLNTPKLLFLTKDNKSLLTVITLSIIAHLLPSLFYLPSSSEQ